MSKVFIIGNESVGVAAHLLSSCQSAGIEVEFINAEQAEEMKAFERPSLKVVKYDLPVLSTYQEPKTGKELRKERRAKERKAKKK
jgi:hypothetical protein